MFCRILQGVLRLFAIKRRRRCTNQRREGLHRQGLPVAHKPRRKQQGLARDCNPRDIPTTDSVHLSAPHKDGCRRLAPAQSLPVSYSSDGLLASLRGTLYYNSGYSTWRRSEWLASYPDISQMAQSGILHIRLWACKERTILADDEKIVWNAVNQRIAPTALPIGVTS